MEGKQWILSIIVTDKWEVDVRYKWDNSLLLSLMGTIKVAEERLLKKYKASVTIWDSWCQQKNSWNETENQYIETEMSKSEALNFYLAEREKLEQRMTAIAQSDDRSSFHINKDLYSKL